MTKEEFKGKICCAYVGDINAMNECIKAYNELLEIIEKAEDFIKDYKYWLQDSDLVDRKKVDGVINYILDILKGGVK